MAKIRDAPGDLGAQIARIAQRQNRVIVGLCDRAAVPMVALRAEAIGLDDARVGLGLRGLHPSHQGRPEVETQVRIVIDDALDLALAVDDTRKCIGSVALEMNTLVPIMKWTRAIFAIEGAAPGILAGRLVEMTVDNDRQHDY